MTDVLRGDAMNHDEILSNLPGVIAREVFDVLCGEWLGGGLYRGVYACAPNPDLVVKIETRARAFSNVLEWDAWNEWRDEESVAKWLAPCHSISACGAVLLMKRTQPMKLNEMPKRLPKFLTDTKVSNYGELGGRVVCHDYAFVRTTLKTKKRKVAWRDE